MKLYIIPFEKQFIIYRPLRQLAFIGNRILVDYIQDLNNEKNVNPYPEIDVFLEQIDFWKPDIDLCQHITLDNYCPTMGVLMLTNQCNLRCVYCYANAGQRKLETMSWSTAKVVIDTLVKNAKKSNKKEFILSYHGGGEQTVNWQLFQKTVEYASNQEIPCSLTFTSNGMWNKEQCNFILNNFSSVSLSVDGISKIQNRQRPFTDGSASFNLIKQNLNAMDKKEIDYGIRMTVLPESLDYVLESVKYFCENTDVLSIQIEPTYTKSRGEYADMERKFGDKFSKIVLEAIDIGDDYECSVYYSAARPWVTTELFCGAPHTALIVTPTGTVTTCFEITSPKLPYAKDFIIGEVTKSKVMVNINALQNFIDKEKKRREKCKNCFCYWHCAGDCATRSLTSVSPNSVRCNINRTISIGLIAKQISIGNGVWQGIKEKGNKDNFFNNCEIRKT